MTEVLNGYFSSVFTRKNISTLPVPDAKFQEAKSDYLCGVCHTLMFCLVLYTDVLSSVIH